MKLSNILSSCSIDMSQFYNISNRKKAKSLDITEQEFINQIRNQQKEIFNKEIPLSDYTIESNLKTSIYNDKISIDSNNQAISVQFQYSLKDVSTTDFMRNFLVKESYYRDEINKNFSGDELNQKLDSLDSISNKVMNELSADFSRKIGDFFEGKHVDDMNMDLNNSLSDGYNEKFDVEEFKNNIINTMNNQRKLLDNIKKENPDDWNDVLNSNGTNINYFTKKLNEASNNAFSTSVVNDSSKLEDMSYSDILSVSKAVTYMNSHRTYTMDAYMFGSFLGEEKLKSNILLNSLNLSDSVKNSLTYAVDKSIEIRMNIFTQIYINTPIKIPGNSYNVLKSSFDSFANLSDTDSQNFSKKLKEMLDTLYTKHPSTVESPGYYKYFSDLINSKINDWNDFIAYLDIDKSKKDGYYIKGFIGNKIDNVS